MDEFENLTDLEIKEISVSNFDFLKSCQSLQNLTLVLKKESKQKYKEKFPTLKNLQKIILSGFNINSIKTVISSLREDISKVTIEAEIPGLSINELHKFITGNQELLQKINSFKGTPDIKNDLLKQSVYIHKFYQESIQPQIAEALKQNMAGGLGENVETNGVATNGPSLQERVFDNTVVNPLTPENKK